MIIVHGALLAIAITSRFTGRSALTAILMIRVADNPVVIGVAVDVIVPVCGGRRTLEHTPRHRPLGRHAGGRCKSMDVQGIRVV